MRPASRRPLVGAVAVGVALLLGSGAAAAQSAPIEGTWQVRWAQGVRNNGDGSVEVQRWGDAILSRIEFMGRIDGDALEGFVRLHIRDRDRPTGNRPLTAVRAPIGSDSQGY